MILNTQDMVPFNTTVTPPSLSQRQDRRGPRVEQADPRQVIGDLQQDAKKYLPCSLICCNLFTEWKMWTL